MSHRWLEPLQFQFLILERRDQASEERQGLLLFGRRRKRQLEMAMRLKLGRFIAEGALDALAKLELSTGEGALEIRKAIPSEIFKFRYKSLQLFNALGEVVDRKRFRPRPLRFCPCHRMCGKCSPRPLD